MKSMARPESVLPGTKVDVLHIVPAYHPARGGIEVLVEQLTTGLRERHGISSAVLAPSLPGQRSGDYVHKGTRVYSVMVAPKVSALVDPRAPQQFLLEDTLPLMAGVYATARRVIRECAPSVVHVHASSLAARPAMAVAASLGIEIVIHLHGTIHEGDTRTFRSQIRDARWVCAVSQAVADSIRRDCGRTAPVVVIRNGVVDPWATTVPYNPASPTVAMVGRLSYEKGFDDGLVALRQVREAHPGLEVRLVGNGPDVRHLLSVATRLGMVDAIRYFGELEHDQGLRVIAGSDVVLVPSIGVEGFGLVVVEAALLERPVVATRVGGLPETVVDGKTGILVAPRNTAAIADAVTSLLSDPARRAALGSLARARALEEFSPIRFIDDVANIYGLIATRGSDVDASEQDGHE